MDQGGLIGSPRKVWTSFPTALLVTFLPVLGAGTLILEPFAQANHVGVLEALFSVKLLITTTTNNFILHSVTTSG